jgi:MFS transporter, PPP family, 3-phenylpropionic acid transporter
MEQAQPATTAIPASSDWMIKALNVGVWGAAAFYFPYINVYFRDIGLSGTQIGLIGMVSSLVAALGAMLWGVLTDRLGKPRLLFAICSLGSIVFVLLLGQTISFPWILLIIAFFSLFNRPIYTLVDTTTLQLLGEHRDRYGAYRVWGTLGFVAVNLVSGPLLQRTGLHTMFYAFPLGILLFWLITTRLPDHPVRGAMPPRSRDLWEMLRQPRWLLFAVTAFILWIPAMGGLGFVGVMARDMGASELQISWLSTIAAIAEVPLFLVGARALRKFGPTGLILLAIAAYSLRMFLYAVVPDVPSVLALSLLQSISYCPFLVGAIAYAHDLAPAHLKATSQGVLATILSLGSLAGTLLAGWLYDHVARSTMYTTFGLVALLALLIFATGLRRQRIRL